MWKSVTGSDFKSDVVLSGTLLDSRSRSTERGKYINWVNRVIRQHKGPALDAFKICFNNWVKFTISKKVKLLELNLLEYENSIWVTRLVYIIAKRFVLQVYVSTKYITYLIFPFKSNAKEKSSNLIVCAKVVQEKCMLWDEYS